jgi:hypothetical protein
MEQGSIDQIAYVSKSLGSILGTLGAVFLAMIFWRIQRIEQKFRQYIDVLQAEYILPQDLLYLNAALLLPNGQYLDRVELRDFDRNNLSEFIDKHEILIGRYLFYIFLMLITAFILQISSLVLISMNGFHSMA